MDYFITLNDKSIDAIGEAVEKPITVIEGLKETVAEQAETIAEQAEDIGELEGTIEELEGELANSVKPLSVTLDITNKTGNSTDIIVVIPSLTWGTDHFKVDSSGINGANGAIAVGNNYRRTITVGYIEDMDLMLHLYILNKTTYNLVGFNTTNTENLTAVGADVAFGASNSIKLSNITSAAISVSFTVKGI